LVHLAQQEFKVCREYKVALVLLASKALKAARAQLALQDCKVQRELLALAQLESRA
jgi:hypothetical protein